MSVDHRRRTLWTRLAFAAALAFAGSAVLANAAVAGQAVSAHGFYSVGGINYENYAAINTNHDFNHQAYSVTLVKSTNQPIPGGWAGAMPRRMDGNGTLLCSGTYTYNGGQLAVGAVLNPSGCFINNHSVYSSRGLTRAWNGASYVTYNTFLSPNQNS